MSMNLQNPPDILMGVVQSTTYPNGDTLPYAPANLVPVSTGTQWTTTPIGSHAPLTSISAAYSASNANHTILATLSAGFTVTLPAAASMAVGQELVIKNIAGAFTLTIAPSGSDHIEGSASSNTYITAANYYVRLISDGVSNWWITGQGVG